MLTRIDNWSSSLSGCQIQVRLNGRTVCSGIVGEVSACGTVLWIQPFTGVRRAFDQHDSYEAWAVSAPAR